jgi:hypothetical protein
MAIGRITGQMLSANLARSGTDLTFETNLLALDVTNSRIGVGTASPAVTLHVSATDALRLPSGDDSQRPGSPANGDLRYNTDQTTIEGYANGAWANLASGTQLKDADEDTSVDVEPSSDLDEVHITTAGSKVAKFAASTIELGVTGISTTASTITGLSTNGDITLTPNGTGSVIVTNGSTFQTDTADINGGAIDGVTIGSNSAATALVANGGINIDDDGDGAIDGVVIGANTAAAGTFTTITTTGNATIAGDLTVNGTTTTIDSTTLTIEDPLIQLAKNNSGGDANTFDQGLFFNRGSLDNVSFLWDESADEFAFAVTASEDGTTAGNVTVDSYANLHVGDVTSTGALKTDGLSIFDNEITGTRSNEDIFIVPSGTGNVVINSADINGGAIDNTVIGGNTTAAGNFTSVNASAAVSITSDSTNLNIGAGNDLQLSHDGTNSLITNTTGDLAITTAAGSEVVINEAGADVNFRVEGDTATNLFVVDASADAIGIGTATPGFSLDMGSQTDALLLPSGSDAQRVGGTAGVIRFNTDSGTYEGTSDGSTWTSFATAGAAPTFTKETATGDGSTQAFTGFFSSAPESANNVFVYIDNVYQEPTENYSVSGTTLTFTSAPHSGARIFAITGADGTSLVTGGIARTETSAVSVSGSSATTIMSFNAATYRSAEIFITIQDSGNTEYSAMKGVVIHDGTTAYGSTFGVTNTGSNDLAVISFNHDGSNTVEVKATPNNSGTQSIKVQYSLLA